MGLYSALLGVDTNGFYDDDEGDEDDKADDEDKNDADADAEEGDDDDKADDEDKHDIEERTARRMVTIII